MILHSPAYEDGTDSEFRNVGNWNSDARELPKKEQITFRKRRKLKNKNMIQINDILQKVIRTSKNAGHPLELRRITPYHHNITRPRFWLLGVSKLLRSTLSPLSP